MQDLDEIRNVMLAFQAGSLTPAQFIKRYNALWRELRDEQYATPRGARLRSGTPESEALSQLFGEADAYREEPDAPGEVYLTRDELHQAVDVALQVLDDSA
jgi:hypothetical protein